MGLLQLARSHCSLPRLIFPVQSPCREKINFSRMHCAMCTVVRLYTSSVFMHGRRGFSFRKAASEMPPPDRTNVRCGRALTDWTRRSTYHAKYTELNRRKHRIVLMYMSSAAILCVGLSYAAVPLYRMYCQATGYGGTTRRVEDLGTVLESMVRADDRMLTVRFSGDTSGSLQWKFKPQQSEIKLAPGETALAFYTAENLTDSAIIGISTYNVIPFDAGQYFNKIQCFCFEEQRLNPREQVDMPVFFYIDPEFTEDPAMAKVDTITLAYTFFEAKESHSPVAVGHG